MAYEELERALDQTKAKVFLSDNAAFLGSIMCSLNFVWSTEVSTAATDGITFWWNPDWFKTLDDVTRRSIMLHELWHVGRLHMIRRGTRDPQIWNEACDYRINNDLDRERERFNKVSPLINHDLDKPDIMVEEDIYDLLRNNGAASNPGGSWGDGSFDLRSLSDQEQTTVIQTVVKAVQMAKLSKKAGNLPGIIEQTINKFLDPIVPWQTLLMRFFTDLLDEDYSWSRPNRRYTDMYLPGKIMDDGRLEHLMFFEDVSGSITDKDLLRFNSEVKHVKDVLNPKELTLVQFDTRIQSVKLLTEDDSFNEVVICGRGGTSLEPVKQYIEKHQPTAVVIFSDLECAPMDPLRYDIPVVWVVLNNKGTRPPFGTFIHINN